MSGGRGRFGKRGRDSSDGNKMVMLRPVSLLHYRRRASPLVPSCTVLLLLLHSAPPCSSFGGPPPLRTAPAVLLLRGGQQKGGMSPAVHSGPRAVHSRPPSDPVRFRVVHFTSCVCLQGCARRSLQRRPAPCIHGHRLILYACVLSTPSAVCACRDASATHPARAFAVPAKEKGGVRQQDTARKNGGVVVVCLLYD